MGYKLFVDSDVVLDFFTDREPHANPASELFELNEQGELKIYLSAVNIYNIYYIVNARGGGIGGLLMQGGIDKADEQYNQRGTDSKCCCPRQLQVFFFAQYIGAILFVSVLEHDVEHRGVLIVCFHNHCI